VPKIVGICPENWAPIKNAHNVSPVANQALQRLLRLRNGRSAEPWPIQNQLRDSAHTSRFARNLRKVMIDVNEFLMRAVRREILSDAFLYRLVLSDMEAYRVT
jgi:hypothetical protein